MHMHVTNNKDKEQWSKIEAFNKAKNLMESSSII